MSTTIIAPPLPDAPYRGIEPFRFTDQQIFAARTDETWTLLSNVTLYRAVLLYGASGTGKSSLINAGFLPQILKENQIPDRLRVQPFAGREIKVERIRMSGREEQAAYLPSNFAPEDSNTSAESIELSLTNFRARLEEFRLEEFQPPAETQASVDLFHAPRTTPRPLLIFDQFEEFITLFEEAQRVDTSDDGGAALTAQADILQTLVELIQDETLPVKIIFAFREDYLAKLSLLFEYCPELLDQAQRLVPPSIEALPAIIRAPFTNPELRAHFLKQTAGSEIGEPLAQEIGAELSRRSEGGTANLTELQIVCQRLWHAPDAEQLFAKDGIEGLLKSYGSDVFRNFTPELRDAAVVMLSHMITASNTRNIISEEDLLSRTTDCNFQPAQCTSALTALSQSQIVRREPRHSIYFYEITSEYLVPWIKERVAERKSAENQRLAEAERVRLEKEKAEAVARFETERRRGRVMKILLLVSLVLGVAVVILGWWGLKQYRQLRTNEASIKDQRDQLQKVQDALKAINSPNKTEALQGVEDLGTLIKENKVPSELKNILITTVSTTQDQSVRQAAYKELTQAAQSDGQLSQSIVKAAENSEALAQQLPPRFYIHYADDSQVDDAKKVANALKRQGYIVPGIQKAIDPDARTNQLRYFRKDEPGIPTPDALVSLLKNATGGNWRAFYIQANSAKIRPGHFEIWFPAVAPKETETPSTDTGGILFHFADHDGNSLRGEMPNLKIVNSSGQEVMSGYVKEGATVSDLKEGTYQVFADLKGYETTSKEVIVKAGSDKFCTVKFSKIGPQPSPTAYQYIDPADQRKRRRP